MVFSGCSIDRFNVSRPLPVGGDPVHQGDIAERGLDHGRLHRHHHRRQLLRRTPGATSSLPYSMQGSLMTDFVVGGVRDDAGVVGADHEPRHQGPDPAQTHPGGRRGQTHTWITETFIY